jgi:hypothetical protein
MQFALIAAFRSAKGRLFAERKATNGLYDSAIDRSSEWSDADIG